MKNNTEADCGNHHVCAGKVMDPQKNSSGGHTSMISVYEKSYGMQTVEGKINKSVDKVVAKLSNKKVKIVT